MKPRVNKEQADRYYADDTLKAWWWREGVGAWAEDRWPNFEHGFIWHVGHEAPTEPPVKMCALGGIEFPKPLEQEPQCGEAYWLPNPCNPEYPTEMSWANDKLDREWLAGRMCQATEAGSILQGRAMQSALQQAVEEAK